MASPSTSPRTAGRAPPGTSLATGARAALALAVLWLALAADVLYGGPVSSLDVWLAERVHAVRGSELARALLFWSNLHSQVAMLVYAALFAALLARRRVWDWAAGVALAVPGAMVLNYALKLAIQRTRPVLENPIL